MYQVYSEYNSNNYQTWSKCYCAKRILFIVFRFYSLHFKLNYYRSLPCFSPLFQVRRWSWPSHSSIERCQLWTRFHQLRGKIEQIYSLYISISWYWNHERLASHKGWKMTISFLYSEWMLEVARNLLAWYSQGDFRKSII